MRKLILYVLLFLNFTSCVNDKPRINKPRNKTIDTLVINENTFSNVRGVKSLEKRFVCNHEINKLYKNKPIDLKFIYRNELFKIISKSNVFIESNSSQIKVTKIDNTNFTILIDPQYNKNNFDLLFCLGPKFNYCIKTYFSDIVVHPNYVEVCKFNLPIR